MVVFKNLVYQYFGGAAGDPFFHIILMKLSFSGFMFGMIFSNSMTLKKIKKTKQQQLIIIWSFIILLAGIINYIEILSIQVRTIMSLVMIFFPATYFGLLFSISVKELKKNNLDILFTLLFGSCIGIAIYNFIFVYISFPIAYLCIYSIITLLFVKKTLAKFEIICILIFSIIIMVPFHNYGQIYYPPLHANGSKHYKTIMGPYGILDVLEYKNHVVTYSDKVSSSIIIKNSNFKAISEYSEIPFKIKNPNSVLIIGMGGGQDILAALKYNVSDITSVEIDKQRIHLLKNELAEYTNHFIFNKKIKIIQKSGLNFLKENQNKFDEIIIQTPFTDKILSTHIFDMSQELFTEFSINKSLESLEDEGILFWGIPSMSELKYRLQSIKNNFNILNDQIVIFKLAPDTRQYIVCISQNYNFTQFYKLNNEKYKFYYYPGFDKHNDTNEIADFLNKDNELDVKFKSYISKISEKSFFKIFNFKRLTTNLILIIFMISLITLFFVRFKKVEYPIYLFLGIGYELISIFFIFWLPFFILDFVKLLPINLMSYYLLGSLGYLISKNLSKRKVLIISILISFLLFLILFIGLVVQNMSETIMTVFFITCFLIIGIIVTIPFGFIINHKKKLYTPLLIDYFGSVLSFIIIYLIPNLYFILFLSIIIYLIIGFLIAKLNFR